MPRAAKGSSKPSAGGKYAKTNAGTDNGRQIALEDVTSPEGLWALVEDSTALGVSITLAMTRDYKTISVTFFHDGERYPWYIQSREDWQDMIQAIES